MVSGSRSRLMMASAASLLPAAPVPDRLPPASRYCCRRRRTPWTAVLAILVCLFCRAMALTVDSHEPVETLLIDPRVRDQEDGVWTMLSEDEIEMRTMRKRAEEKPKITTTFSIAVSTVTQAATTSTVPASPLPSPFDGALSSNFTKDEDGIARCPAFLNSFLTAPTFKQCYPLSLLLQVSFFPLVHGLPCHQA